MNHSARPDDGVTGRFAGLGLQSMVMLGPCFSPGPSAVRLLTDQREEVSDLPVEKRTIVR